MRLMNCTRGVAGAAAAFALVASFGAQAADPASCKEVNFADVGWTDITATTAATSVVLEGLGYAPEAAVLSVPVTYASLKNGDIDVFLGNWMPTWRPTSPSTAKRSEERRVGKEVGSKGTFWWAP